MRLLRLPDPSRKRSAERERFQTIQKQTRTRCTDGPIGFQCRIGAA
jgi:hypothetical protein